MKQFDFSELYEPDTYEPCGNIVAAERICANYNLRIQGTGKVEPVSREMAQMAFAARDMRKPVQRSQYAK